MARTTVVILAAGRGKRLAPLTDERPKCLLSVGRTTPLDLCLDALAGARSLAEVRIVVGHAHERIAERVAARRDSFAVREVFNPRFDDANNLVSALCVADLAGRPFVIVNSDVVCHPAPLVDAVDRVGDFLVIDPTHPPREEAMKVRYANERLVAIGKDLEPATADGEYIGIAAFSPAGGTGFFAAARRILAGGGDQEWYEAAIGAAAAAHAIGRRETNGLPWIEIDDPSDLERARTAVLPRIAPAAGNVGS
jgi:L-glutamine-phosphate cytidylyltransferase